MRRVFFALTFSIAGVAPAPADEGMFTFDNFPAKAVEDKYGAEITPAWLDRVRRATVRLTGCTANLVSKDGLMLTNHHCVEGCLQENSTKERSLIEAGFVARSQDQELRCKVQLADVLVATEDVTSKVAAATDRLDEKAANNARKKILNELEAACQTAASTQTGGPLQCQAVTLYSGGQYYLYKYKRYTDVRLAFAPEVGIASFGGDVDNFQYPRWNLDMSLLRVYENDKPAATPNHLSIDFDGPAAGDAVFVPGHPGSTNRQATVAQLITMRNLMLPAMLYRGMEVRGRLIQFGKQSEANERIVVANLFGVENQMKVRRKQLDALHEEALYEHRRAAEADLKAKIAADPKLKAATGDPWADIARAQGRLAEIHQLYVFIEDGFGFYSQMFTHARNLVRGTVEREKPNSERLSEYTEARLPRVLQMLGADVPLYPEVERLTFSFGLERMREYLGLDHPVVRKVLGSESPDSLAARLVGGSALGKAEARMALWKGGRAAVEASTDPMIVLARAVEPDARALRTRYDDEVDAPVARATEKLAKARFAVYGTKIYPDANFTLRINYGKVEGWVEGGVAIEPFTRLGKLYERATGKPPFKLPDSWVKAKASLQPQTPVNFTTNNDITGGNSGSPAVNAKGDIVGLAFDGNIHSIAGSYWFDETKNRMVSVHPAFMKEALTKVYNATALYQELGGR